MGYDTYWSSEVEITPPLTLELIKEFNDDTTEYGWNGPFDPFTVTEHGHNLVLPDDSIRGFDMEDKLDVALTWMADRGRDLNGHFHWSGEEDGDLGTVVVRHSKFQIHPVHIEYTYEWVNREGEASPKPVPPPTVEDQIESIVDRLFPEVDKITRAKMAAAMADIYAVAQEEGLVHE